MTGEFVTLDGERYYAIRNVDRMPPFFISLVSDHDSWMFIASNGGLTAGRESPEQAIFPYVTVDKIYDSVSHTGSKTLLRAWLSNRQWDWEPFNNDHDSRFRLTRNLYKNTLGNKLIFEEVNEDLQLRFRYAWSSSSSFGFVRTASIENSGAEEVRIEIIDGLLNLLPAGTPRFAQTNTSYLVDAYKWSEVDEQTGLAFFTLYSAISDRAEPCESLRATTAFCVGLDEFQVLLAESMLSEFRRGDPLETQPRTRGTRGAYLVHTRLRLAAGTSRQWAQVVDTGLSQAETISLLERLRGERSDLRKEIAASVEISSDQLARIMAAADAFQHTAEETVSTHHYANVLFNVLRGGIVNDNYHISKADFLGHIRHFNHDVYGRNRTFLESLADSLQFGELITQVREQQDSQLERLTLEYLPITFGRRHGDPSRPWNQFSIRLTDEHEQPLLSYEGNWRDIFQNWEALLLSYPEFTENVIAKFVNASTADGYNPYRITDRGIDWEVEDPEDPWSYIGYWGDHQIIYLQKLLELSQHFHPSRLDALLHKPVFCYANVPYRIKAYEDLKTDAKNTIEFDNRLAEKIERRVAELGADGKLLVAADGGIHQVTLLEKLLVPLLAKLGNLVVDGGIWLNTQRPEWNDANNALVGHGLSMVTLCYMRRYLCFLQQLLQSQQEPVALSAEVADWLQQTADALGAARTTLDNGSFSQQQRYQLLELLGQAASRYRLEVYEREGFSGTRHVDPETLRQLAADALQAVDHSIATNLRPDGLYHAYNLIHLNDDSVEIEHLYTMLEGQVAALSSGAVAATEAVRLLEALFDSDLFRADQQSFLLYPDRDLPGYLEKNRIPAARIEALPELLQLIQKGDSRLVGRDTLGNYRFNASLVNVSALDERLDELSGEYGNAIDTLRQPLHDLYEEVFNHKAFTGRSGGMFGFEGLGSIYWHMVSKLLLAVQESYFDAHDSKTDTATLHKLAHFYYRVRAGLGFNKTPLEYGAFPTDPYSHTPAHAGAQQPGMTGQVKEEILTRFGELGIRVENGTVRFDPTLLRRQEFCSRAGNLRYLDVAGNWQTLAVPQQTLAFTWCQVPVLYRLHDGSELSTQVSWRGGRQESAGRGLSAEIAAELFCRTGKIEKLELEIPARLLFDEQQ